MKGVIDEGPVTENCSLISAVNLRNTAEAIHWPRNLLDGIRFILLLRIWMQNIARSTVYSDASVT